MRSRDWVVNFVACRWLSLRITSELRLELFGENFFPILFRSAQYLLLIFSFTKNLIIERNSPSVWQWQAIVYILLISEVMDISWLVVGLVQVIVWPLVAFSFYYSSDYLLAIKNMRAIFFSKHMCNYVWLWTTWILICTIYTVTCMFLFLSQVKHWIQSCSQEWMQNKSMKTITSNFIFLCVVENSFF